MTEEPAYMHALHLHQCQTTHCSNTQDVSTCHYAEVNMDAMVDRRTPRVLQYGVIQMILFVMGIMLAVGVVKETGAYDELMEYLGVNDSQPFVWLHGVAAGVLSTVLDNFATAINFFSLPDEMGQTGLTSELSTVYSCNGLYWRVVAFCVMAGGNILGYRWPSG